VSNITEKHVENAILDYLLARGLFVFKNQSTGIYDPTKRTFRKKSKYQINGVSDIAGILPDGRAFYCEVKKPYISKKTNKIAHRTQEQLEKLASEDQLFFIDKVKKLNGVAFLADSLEVVEDQLILFGVF
jgi:hypothetical protein